MKTEHYKTKELIIGGSRVKDFYIAFDKKELPIDQIVKLLDEKRISNQIGMTENFILFENHGYVSWEISQFKKDFQKIRMTPGVVIAALMSYKEYFVTATAKKVITENKIDEGVFENRNFVSVHEGKLTIEKIISKYRISLELSDLSVKIEDMEKRRKEQIKERILSMS